MTSPTSAALTPRRASASTGLRRYALALGRHFLGEAAVDNEPALVANREPAEIIHGHRPVVRIAAGEIVLSAPLAGRVAQCINPIARKVVIVRHRSRALCSVRPFRLGG